MIVLRLLFTAIAKETRLILRDLHALAILFVMPVVFVTILSLALRDVFTERAGGVAFDLLIVNQDSQLVGNRLDTAFSGDKHFRVKRAAAPFPDLAAVTADVDAGRYKFALVIPAQATAQARRRATESLDSTITTAKKTAPVEIQLIADPALRADHRSMVTAIASGVLRGIESELVAERVAALLKSALGENAPAAGRLASPTLFADIGNTNAANKSRASPTSVQQNVPAWTVLAMFFLAVPLSVTFIRERAQGSLQRLQSMPVPGWVLLGGKIAPYLVINQIQLALILTVGVYGLPLLGGDRLTLGHAPEAIAVLGISTSLAAIGFSLLIASFARTSEQATTFSAVTVLVLAALGGIMVPKLVMPPFMQQLAGFSPFSWGLDGFLELFVRDGGLADVLPDAGRLLAFAAVCLTVAGLRFARYRQ
ncbi:MAG: ABC transporter permease [Gammaproteobacteria bacterium]|nr:ABC transporter permease [Gammaproteobacteria bacterium]